MNLKYQFYKGYYKGFDPCWFGDDNDPRQKKVVEKNRERFEAINGELFNYEPKQNLSKWLYKTDHFDHLCQFPLETTYPGLVSGTGYTHETGNVGEFKIGFHFDHTSGLPMLPGHSVKGALRAAFPRHKMEPKSEEPLSIKAAKAAYIVDLLGLTEKVAAENRLAWVTELELQIFGSSHTAIAAKTEDENGTKKPPPKDVFLDAMICKADKNDKILGPDSITPHDAKVWKNPIPLLFLKVLPGVQWQFSFLLTATKIKDIDVTAAMKEKLFKDILLDLGIGAKSNVGYGHFIDTEGSGSEVEYYPGKLKYRNQFEVYAEVLKLKPDTMVKVFLKEDNCPLGNLGRNMNNKNDLKEGDILMVEVKLKRDLKSIEYVNFVTNKSKN